MQDISKKLNLYVQLSQKVRSKLLRWAVRQNEDLLYEAFLRQKDHVFALSRYKNEDKSVLYFAAFILAVNDLYSLVYPSKGKNRLEQLNEVEDATSIVVIKDRQRRGSPIWNKLLNLKSKILVLKDEERLSFRQISNFLKRYHKLEVSHSYISSFYHQIKEKK